MLPNKLQHVEHNSGRVTPIADGYRLTVTPTQKSTHYTNAQLDDYQALTRTQYLNTPNSQLSLNARFSHAAADLEGTAGFGFWNACYADINAKGVVLPKATWFFFGSQHNHLPFTVDQPGNGWLAHTIDVNQWRAWRWFPSLAPLALLNRIPRIQRWVMPKIFRDFNIGLQHLAIDITQWHHYQLDWNTNGCVFKIDNTVVLETSYTPQGPLGFVCWIDNQYLSVTTTGRFKMGVTQLQQAQWLEITHLQCIASPAK